MLAFVTSSRLYLVDAHTEMSIAKLATSTVLTLLSRNMVRIVMVEPQSTTSSTQLILHTRDAFVCNNATQGTNKGSRAAFLCYFLEFVYENVID